jgi:hypothetical protein
LGRDTNSNSGTGASALSTFERATLVGVGLLFFTVVVFALIRCCISKRDSPPLLDAIALPTRRRSITPASEVYDVFISFRFGEAHAEALALKAALEQQQLRVFLSDVAAGGDLQDVISQALVNTHVAVILASKTYGQKTNRLFDTSNERNFIVEKRKPFYLVRMICVNEEWKVPATAVAFSSTIMYKLWLPGEQMPPGMVDEIVKLVEETSSTRGLGESSLADDAPSRYLSSLSQQECYLGADGSTSVHGGGLVETRNRAQSSMTFVPKIGWMKSAAAQKLGKKGYTGSREQAKAMAEAATLALHSTSLYTERL